MADAIPSAHAKQAKTGRPPLAEALRPLVADAQGVARLLDAALRTVRTWDASGKLPKPLRIAGKVVWRVAEIRAWLNAGAPPREEWEARLAARKAARRRK